MFNGVRFFRDRSGSSAVEFAIVAPIFFLVLLTMIAYGIYLMAAYSVQQIDAARTAVAGLNTTERQQLARDFVTKSDLSYAFMDKSRFTVDVATDPANANQFTVKVEYDARDLPIWSLYSYTLPEPVIRRFSTIRIGGA
jgi:Flp pilus assembly protein TadG